jgi:hypothetical protein
VPHVVDEITLTGLPDVIKNSFDFGIAFNIRVQGKGAHMNYSQKNELTDICLLLWPTAYS